MTTMRKTFLIILSVCVLIASLSVTMPITSFAADIPATSIAINFTLKTAQVGESFKIQTAITPSDSTDKLTWKSSNSTVVSVSDSGMINALSPGTAVITVTTTSGKTSSCTLIVPEISAESVTINAPPSTIYVDDSFKLQPTVTPSNSTDKLTWTSSNSTVVSVSSTGMVSALKPGTAVITVTTTSGKSASRTLTVASTSVTINSPPSIIYVGDSFKLQAVKTPSESTEKLTWTSSNSAVVSVSDSGMINALSPGTAVITVTTASGNSASRTLTVISDASTLSISNVTVIPNITQGTPVVISGLITSNYKITSVTVGVYSASSGGTAHTEANATPNATSYNINSLDLLVRIASVPAGTKHFRVTVTDESGTTKTLVNQEFTISASTYRDKIVEIAQSQIGNKGSKYWTWYPCDPTQWCHIFVSWCANEADKSTGLNYLGNKLPKSANCGTFNDTRTIVTGTKFFYQKNNLKLIMISYETSTFKAVDYTPQKGDFIYFDWDMGATDTNGYRGSDHVGIVEKCENGIVYTIEGNKSVNGSYNVYDTTVQQRTYSVNSPYIYGYGTY